ncbi:Uncharacterised protein [Helicobacter canis]|uniref:Uncharacterized protein n=1 Tax=Helicobacter canis TaxID=29419 RepID=A0A377J250_9HELI|nr:Uncharacterised protein [Helicobacter canis]
MALQDLHRKPPPSLRDSALAESWQSTESTNAVQEIC